MNTIHITAFRDFLLEYRKITLPMDKNITHQLSNLLQILVYHHKNGITKEELMDILWTDNANPQNALKYSIFRLRSALKEISVLKDAELIVTTKRGYIFAPDYEVETDFDRIDQLYSKVKDHQADMHDRMQILSLYKGAFFSANDTIWAARIRTYYQNLYEKTFSIACAELLKQNSYSEVLTLSEQAMNLNIFHDDAYAMAVRAYIGMGNRKQARSVYTNFQELYEKEYGVLPVDISHRFQEMLKSQEEDIIDVESLKQKLNSDVSAAAGAFYCEYEFFKYIYQVSLRNAVRERKKIFLLVFQISCHSDDKKQLDYMNKLKMLIASQLRSGDVFSRINQSQIIILLPCDSMENGYRIIQRITSSFYKKVNKEKARLHYFISSLNDFDEARQNEHA